MGTQFCTTTTTACNTVSGCVDHSISVSGIGVLSASNVLNAIYVNLGSPTCQQSLASYDLTIIAPDGTILNFIVDLTASTATTAGWVNTTFVDNPNLERIANDYSASDQNLYNPWSIGYYRPETGYSSLVGENADGNWTFRVCESATGNMISFNSACLYFGPPVPTTVAPTNIDDCASAQCLDNTSLINADNDGSEGDALYPGDVVDGCTWNSGNHESSWFKFQPTGSTARIVLSGLDAPSGLGFQPIILENVNGNGCPTSASDWRVPTGGCPDDESINNTAYLSTNGGGVSTAGAVYSNDINFNAEFNLSGLTPNKVYYLYVDGNTATVDDPFVVQMFTQAAGPTTDVNQPNSAIHCSMPLPVEFLDFVVVEDGEEALIYWTTATETNNHKFIIEKSKDNRNWSSIGEVFGAGNSSSEQEYRMYDENPYNGTSYYRIKQVDYDGQFSYSFVRSFLVESRVVLEPNPTNGEFTVYGLDKYRNNDISIYNILGQKVYETATKNGFEEISIRDLEDGVYYLTINQTKTIKFVKETF
jgi:hypothetical protein